MTPRPQTVLFLHGLGARPSSWSHQIANLLEGFTGVAPTIAGLAPGGDDTPTFTLEAASDAVRDELDRLGVERAHVCGLSLGAMVATRFAIDHPARVASLVLSAGQVHPNRALMRVQRLVMGVLPERVVAQPGLDRARVLAVVDAAAAADFRTELGDITARTLVVCGERDRPNLPAARELAAGIANASLEILSGGRHELNTASPTEFSNLLNRFLLGH
ncbi:alpha/beta fold hydrolase [Pseudoclavibacter chungangensis]|uniref:Alpha/beta fold hydrolase n=1 Tax=Pseudoclavibacter chungangensis TaxID=587635 RepID=A0A7J5BZU5_9MICO|nr:alpha/beta fold hydrolase [Pseudoclavibacter chungangensis]KAB1659433.1 alpha/beta fold hydrolase [Pseudoclavibacter chungangensis]NYJ67719.1 pimeloyl-ACP methyl ester carboxylesterase [Pseudoclavibacter chungangensis]